MDFFRFILLGIHLASWICKVVSYKIWKVFSLYFLKYFLSPALFFSWDSDDTNSRSFVLVPQVYRYQLLFKKKKTTNFSLCWFGLGNFFCSISKFSDLLLVPFILLLSLSTSFLFQLLFHLKFAIHFFPYVLFFFAKTCYVFA